MSRFLGSELLKVSDNYFIKHTNTFDFKFLSNHAAGVFCITRILEGHLIFLNHTMDFDLDTVPSCGLFIYSGGPDFSVVD